MNSHSNVSLRFIERTTTSVLDNVRCVAPFNNSKHATAACGRYGIRALSLLTVQRTTCTAHRVSRFTSATDSKRGDKKSFTKWPFFDFCQLTYRKLQKPSLEVEPTTLRLMLFIYSFQFSSAFPPTCSNWFSQFHSLSAEKKTFFVSWSWTLTRDLELRPKQGRDEPPCQISRSANSGRDINTVVMVYCSYKGHSFESYCPTSHSQTHAHRWSTALLGP